MKGFALLGAGLFACFSAAGAVRADGVAASGSASATPQAASRPAGRPADGARIQFDATDYSFGRVPNDRAVEHVYKVTNAGNKPLVITRVQTSCGCTAAMMESSVIDPGKTGKLRVSFNPHNQKQAVTRTISVYSNDPVDAVVQLKISANVVQAGEEAKVEAPPARAHPKETKLVLAGACLKCHGPASESEAGMKLYTSACAACHGPAGAGVRLGNESIGPALKLTSMSVKTAAGLRQIIAAGTGHPAMPGYGREYGGVLTDRQVESLVELVLKSFPAR